MSELINNSALRLRDLAGFARGVISGENGKTLTDKYRDVIDTVSATEAMQVLDQMLAEGFPNALVKGSVGKIINAFYKSLSAQQWDKPHGNHFLTYLMRENREAEQIMTNIKTVLKALFKTDKSEEPSLTSDLRVLITKLKLYELHYLKKENILFPYIEKVFPQFRCLELMWSFHDDFRKIIKNLENILNVHAPDKDLLNKGLGKLFFVVLPVIFREEQIVFPVAYRAIPSEYWDEMLQQSHEAGWCYIDPPAEIVPGKGSDRFPEGKINLGTGFLSAGQLMLLFGNLPVDITFVDEKDEVCYFSSTKERIFPRSNAIIGRKVQNCHPHDSVHMVNQILTAFRTGQKDHADFWIQMKGRFILIRYFALRDDKGVYQGTIEVSQDVTAIRGLEGERRLLQWNNQLKE